MAEHHGVSGGNRSSDHPNSRDSGEQSEQRGDAMGTPAIPTVSTRLGIGDRLGRWRVRWAIGRGRYRVNPGLYRVGIPDPASPVVVTANYKLTFDVLRAELHGTDAWILVLDTKGINVWCAAGKGTFGTDELARQVEASNLAEFVLHRRLIVPQLGATGVAAHEVNRRCGFKVVYGPVRARDLKAFLGSRMRATDEMRRVTFTLGERLELVGAELASVLKWFSLALLLLAVFRGGESMLELLGTLVSRGAPVLAGVLAGTVLVPILLPWIPGRAFSLKGGLVGSLVVGATIALMPDIRATLGDIQMFLFGTAVASFLAMQFTGSTTFTSPSGVEWEMRRALPFQLGAAMVAIGIAAARAIAG
jgi:hypothetical protein